MKFGETTDSIYSISLPVQDGFKTPSFPYDKAVKNLEAIDGTFIDAINFGAREHRTATFNVVNLSPSDHFSLMTYVEANLGKKIRVEMENTGERVFGELSPYTGPVLYAYIAFAQSMGESGFSQGHLLYGYSFKLDYAGATSADVPNALNTSQYDFLFKMDCVRITAGCQVANLAALNAITNKPGGSRGLALDTLKVYFYNAATAAWEYQYTPPANNAGMGLKYGVFRLSAFADISGASSGIGGEDFKSGWISERGIKFPRFTVDGRQGPAVEKPEGFAVALDNSTKLWKYPLDNNLAFYGAYCEVYFYDRAYGVVQLIRSGYVNRITFDYSVVNFEIEPLVFLQNKSFPPTVSDNSNFPAADQAARGNPILATYGRWEKGLLQTQAFNMDEVYFSNKKRILNVLAWNGSTLALDVDLDPALFTTVLGYAYSSYPNSSTRFLYLEIVAQSNQSELKKLRKVVSVAISSGHARLTLDMGFKDPVDTTALVKLHLSNTQIIIDGDSCIGLRAAGYIEKGTADGLTLPLELYGKENGVLKAIPARAFKVVADGKENQITVDTNYISLESTGDLTIQDTVPLDIVNPTGLHSIVDKVHTLGYSYFDFGFSPRGVESKEIEVTPIDRITKWGSARAVVSKDARNNLVLVQEGGEGQVAAAFSKTFTTLAWTPFFGATGYRITRFTTQWSNAAQNYSTVMDNSFGAGGLTLANGTHITGSNATVTISGGVAGVSDGSAFMAIDPSVTTNNSFDYVYAVEPIVGSVSQPSIFSNSGKNKSITDGAKDFFGLGLDAAVILIWAVPDNQAAFTLVQDGTDLGGMPIASAVLGWHKITGLTNGTSNKFKIAINCLSIGAAGDTWFYPANTFSDHGSHQLLRSGASYSDLPFATLRDSANCDLADPTDLGYARSWGIVTKLYTNTGLDLPAAAVTFSWLWKLNKEKLGDLSGAKEVRILADFVVRSYTGNNTPVPFIIQLRGLRADKTVAFTIQYKDMTAKAPTEGSSYGAYAQFLNLTGAENGSGLNTNYDTDSSSPNASGLYTGKELWRLPDYLFEDGAAEWAQIEYLMFTITNAAAIPYAAINQASKGYHLGLGGPPKASWAQVRNHKTDLLVEYTRTFNGGLSEPLFARIDGGKKDDGSGTFTGTASAIIEKARNVIDHIVFSLTGQKPKYIGDEMKSRDTWIWRWQSDSSKSTLDMLNMLADNIFGIFVIGADGSLYLRSLNIDEPNDTPVLAFTDSNIIMDSLKTPQGRLRSEIFQKFLLKYNYDPTLGKATESMLIGWDLANSKPIYAGYPRTVEDTTNGSVKDIDGLDSLPDLCRLSTQLYAAGVGINEFGTDPANEKVFEMFYRPTMKSSLTGQDVERDLPNLQTLWGTSVLPPKMAMQKLAKMFVRFHSLDSWYFPLECSIKNVIYNPAITGKKDEAGTADPRLKMGDLITVSSSYFTNEQIVKGKILDMDLGSVYDGFITLWILAPRPPGQFGTFIDNIWDAGAPGARNENNFLFSGNLYGLISENGTFADAGAPGARNQANMTFPDGTFADPKGTGNGKA